MLPTLLMATAVTTFLLLVRALFILADLLISHGVAARSALLLVVLNLPHILSVTLPIGTLFAVLMTAARLSADSELVAAQSLGIRPTRLARPLILVGFVVFAVNAWFTWFITPMANEQFSIVRRRIAFSAVNAAIQPREFVENLPGKLIYVNRMDPSDSIWRGVIVFDFGDGIEEQLVTAQSGRLEPDPVDGSAVLNLQDTVTHVLQPAHPDAYKQSRNQELSIFLRPQGAGDRTAVYRLSARETPSGELLRRLGERAIKPDEKLEALLELHTRLAIPAAALVFALLGFPLGISNRRGGRGYGLTASVLLVVVYYVLQRGGEILAYSGKVPVALGAWLPNVVLAAAGLLLLRSLLSRGAVARSTAPHFWQGWWSRLREIRAAQRARAIATRAGGTEPATDGGGEPPPRPDFAFLGVLDGYVLRLCLKFLGLVIMAVCGLWITVQISENLDDIQKFAPPALVVVSYYFFALPQILHDTLPLAFLIAFLGTATVLERNNETVALKSSGVSLNRVALPLLLLAAALSASLFVLDDQVTNRANRTAQRLEDVIKGRSVARPFRATDRPWMFLPDGRTLVNFMEYDPDAKTLVRLSIYVFDQHMNLRARHMAEKASFVAGKWLGEAAWSRTFLPDGRVEYVPPRKGLTELPVMVAPEYFGKEYRKAAQLSFKELSEYISELRGAGYRVDRLRVALHQKIAYPLSIVLLAWLALPYAFRLGRHGTLMGIGLALVLGMAYFAVLALATSLGEKSMLPAFLAAWTPTVIFALVALNRHTTLKT
jgi:LPS export ABC transporter permease LptG/LPS export ABC transporter permease LptF